MTDVQVLTIIAVPNRRDGWRTVRLGDAGEIRSGITLGRRVSGAATRRVPYLRVANVKDGYLDLSDVNEIEATEVEIEKCRLQKGDLLLTEGGDRDKLGRGTIWEDQLPECIHQNHIFRVRFDPAEFCPKFIAAEVASPYGKAYFLGNAKQTTGIATINQQVLAGFPLLVPPINEQERFASVVNDQMQAVESALVSARDQLKLTAALPGSILRDLFELRAILRLQRAPLGEVCDLLPAKSIATDGDAKVLAITTACLSASGFRAAGLKRARMRPEDVSDSMVSAGEVLVARSNTAELVGQVSQYRGDPANVVATDLTIRILPKPGLLSPYLAAYLSYLHQRGHWLTHASGASGSMKKITRTQLLAEEVPIPSISDQQKVVHQLEAQMQGAIQLRQAVERQLEAILLLPAALLRRVF